MVLVCSVGLLALLVSVQCLTREQLFDYGIQFGDRILESSTDSVKELELEQTLFFFKGKFDKVYVSDASFAVARYFYLHFNVNTLRNNINNYNVFSPLTFSRIINKLI